MSSKENDQVVVVHNVDKHRYEVREGDVTAGFTQYRLPDADHVDFVHTEVDPAYNGRGLASRLVAEALADVRDTGKRIIPHCPYVAGWLERHHDFDDLVDWPTSRR